jgi:hypothetical protein
VSNALSEDKKQQVIASGRLGWSLRRIEASVHIRRETIGAIRGLPGFRYGHLVDGDGSRPQNRP